MAITAKEKALTTYVGYEKALLANTFENQVELLSVETPPHYIKQRQGRGGRNFDYVEFNYVAGRLNATFRFRWDVEIIEKVIDTKSNQIAMWIRLTVCFIDGSIVKKDAWGSADIKRKQGGEIVDLGDDLKAAQSDGIKKAASMFGICWDVYSGHTKENGKPKQSGSIDDPLGDTPIIDVNAEEDDGDDVDIADLASNPNDHKAEIEEIADKIRHKCDERKIEYTAFKNYLNHIQGGMNPKRKFVGKKFNHLSLTEGNLNDLKDLWENIDKTIDKFLNQGKPEELQSEQPSLI